MGDPTSAAASGAHGFRASLRFLGLLVATNLKASLALRGAFWMRAAFMCANNFIFLVVWWAFFERYGEVRGWVLADTCAVYATSAAAFGLSIVLGAGVQEIARLILEGDLDSYLTQPKSVLVQALGARSEPSGWGDMASAVILFGMCGYVSPGTIPLCLVTTVCGAAVFLSTGVLMHSLAFWVGDTRSFSRQAWHFVIIFSIYPRTVFGGWLRIVLFSAITAGFVAYLPVELLREFRWATLLAIAGAAAAYSALAAAVFHLGLRRYASGNRFGVR
jgi:ABC-2 type transport system permease protein